MDRTRFPLEQIHHLEELDLVEACGETIELTLSRSVTV